MSRNPRRPRRLKRLSAAAPVPADDAACADGPDEAQTGAPDDLALPDEPDALDASAWTIPSEPPALDELPAPIEAAAALDELPAPLEAAAAQHEPPAPVAAAAAPDEPPAPLEAAAQERHAAPLELAAAPDEPPSPIAAAAPREPAPHHLPIDEDPEPVPASARGAEVSAPRRATPRIRPAKSRWSLRPLAYGAAALLLFGTGLGVSRFVGAGPQRTRGLPAQLEAERAALSAAVEEARSARDWPRCIERAERLLQLPESPAYPHRRAREALEQAQDEQRNLLGYDRFLQAAARRAPDAAVLTYLELSANSVYRELGAARFLEARDAFVRTHLARARGELDRLGCRAAQPHLDAVLAVDPQSASLPELIAMQARCRAGEAVARGERRGAQRGPAAPYGGEREPVFAPAAPIGERPADRGERPPSRQLEDAQQAYISGNYRQAIRIAQQHTGSDPARAWRVIGGAACYLGDEGLIRKTLDHLDDPAQQFVRQVCQRNGITP